jgi:hypothetical protein
MGLLDDAIRDHLDLKRRRGGDPAEIERAEREALGPVRREPIASEDGTEGPLASTGVEGTEVPLGRSGEVAPSAQGYGAGFDDQDEAEEDDWEEYEDDEYEDEDDEGLEPGHPHPGSDASAGAPGAPDLPPERTPRAHPDDDLEATQLHEIEPAGEPEGGGEDVLEETPEFLQDTPDHDRLWFEQRPPRDFDFEE